ncbi:unnamed protein product, partial [Ectocarpus fasciculatus]
LARASRSSERECPSRSSGRSCAPLLPTTICHAAEGGRARRRSRGELTLGAGGREVHKGRLRRAVPAQGGVFKTPGVGGKAAQEAAGARGGNRQEHSGGEGADADALEAQLRSSAEAHAEAQEGLQMGS